MPEATESDHIPNGPSSNSNNMLAENFFNTGGAALALPLPMAMPVASRKDVDFLVQVSLRFYRQATGPRVEVRPPLPTPLYPNARSFGCLDFVGNQGKFEARAQPEVSL